MERTKRSYVALALLLVASAASNLIVVPAFATAAVQLSASPTVISSYGSTTVTIKATNLLDAASSGGLADTLAVILKSSGALVYMYGPQSMTFSYSLTVRGKSFWDWWPGYAIYKTESFNRVVTFYLDFYVVKAKVRFEDGRVVICSTANEVTSCISSFQKSYRISGGDLWGYQFPWTTVIDRGVYSTTQMSWISAKIFGINIGGGTNTLASNMVNIHITK